MSVELAIMSDEEMSINRLLELARAGALSGSTLPRLMRIARDEPGRASSVAVHLLGTLGPDASEAVPMLVELLQAHREDAFGRTAAKALGAIGAAARAAVPELRLARHSGNKWVRKASREAVERIEAT